MRWITKQQGRSLWAHARSIRQQQQQQQQQQRVLLCKVRSELEMVIWRNVHRQGRDAQQITNQESQRRRILQGRRYISPGSSEKQHAKIIRSDERE